MIYTEEKLSLGQIHQKSDEIFAATLDFDVLVLGDTVHAQMHFGSAGHLRRDFLAHEKGTHTLSRRRRRPPQRSGGPQGGHRAAAASLAGRTGPVSGTYRPVGCLAARDRDSDPGTI